MDEKQQIQTLQSEVKELNKTIINLEQKYQDLVDKKSSSSIDVLHRNVSEVWETHGINFTDPPLDSYKIQSLIRNKTLNVTEITGQGRNLLHWAAYWGNYEVSQLCVNIGADLKQKDQYGNTAKDYARMGSWYHVEQLLILSELHANISDRITQTADIMTKQKGITHNILTGLEEIGQQSKDLFEKILMELMITTINKKAAFSDDLLNVCWSFIIERKEDPLSSDLWHALCTTSKNIIQAPNKIDWFWFKNNVMPSTIWYREISRKDQSGKNEKYYLYYELLKYANEQESKLKDTLIKAIHAAADRNKNDWNQLITFDIKSDKLTSNAQNTSIVRQDNIPNAIVSQFTYNQLSEEFTSSATFNCHKFYDYHQYLTRLALLAQNVDDDFHKSIQNIFSISTDTNLGRVVMNDDELKSNEENPGVILYKRGPVKLLSRARSKAENDYFNMIYPTSACVLDFNRCSLVFQDMNTLLCALNLFCNKVNYYQSGNIIGIVRCKNSWKEYVDTPQYADIKLNVLIRGKHNNIIGELQFLLVEMLAFKRQNHNLYSIQRQEEYIRTSVSVCLPMLLDDNKQIFVRSFMNDVKGLCSLMVFNNKSQEDMMYVDKRGESVLTNICCLGKQQAFNFFKETINRPLFVKRVLFAPDTDSTPLECAASYTRSSLLKNILSIDEIREKLKRENELLRFICALFSGCSQEIIEYALNELNVTKEQMIKSVDYEPKNGKCQFQGVVKTTVSRNNMNVLNYLVHKIGSDNFIHGVFYSDVYNINAFEMSIKANKLEQTKYMLSLEEVKARYAKDTDLLWRVIFWLFVGSSSMELLEYVIDALNITNQQMIYMISHKSAAPSTALQDGAWHYHTYMILNQIALSSTVDKLQKLVSIIGEKVFVSEAFVSNTFDLNCMEHMLRANKIKMMHYALSIDELRGRYLEDVIMLWRLVFWLFTSENTTHEMIECILKDLSLSKTQMIALITRKCTMENALCKYDFYTIVTQIALMSNVEKLKKLVSIIGEKVFVEEVFRADAFNRNVLEYCLQRNKTELLQYVMSFFAVRDRCMNDKEILFRVIWWSHRLYNETMWKYVFNVLQLNDKLMEELQDYTCPKPSAAQFSDHAITYWNKKITYSMIARLSSKQHGL